MSLEQPPANQISPSKGRSRRRRWIWWTVAALAAVLVYIFFLPTPPIAESVLSAMTDENGIVVTTGDISSAGGPVAQATAIKSNVSSVTGSSYARRGDDAWPKQTLAIFSASNHLLMQRVGLALFEGLKESRQFQKVVYAPQGKSLPAGDEIPDVLVTLDMPQFQQAGVQPLVTYDCKFSALIGRELYHKNSFTSANGDPPVVEFQANCQLDYKAEQSGVETSGARYSAVSRDIAGHLQKQILGFLEKADGSPLPPRPQIREFYPAYEPAPRLRAISELNAIPVLEGPRFMQPTSAAWRFESNATPDAIKQLLEQELPESEWNLTWHDRQADSLAASWSRGEERWLVEPAEQESMTIAPPSTTVPIGPRIAPTSYFLIYMRTMSRDAVANAFARMLDRGPNEAAMLPYRQNWHAHRERIEQHFAEHPPTSAATLETLARWKLKDGDQEGARELVLRGWTIDRLFHEGQSRKEFEKLAKDCGIEQLPKTFDVSQLADLGVPDFRDAGTMSLTATAGDDLLILVGASEEEVRTLSIQVRRSVSGQWMLGHVANAIRNGSSSRGSSGPVPIDLTHPDSQWIGHWSVNVSVTPFATGDPDQIGLRFGRKPE